MIAVLEDTVSRLALISLVPTAPDTNLVARIPDSSDPLKVAIQQQWQIEESHRVIYGTVAVGKVNFEEVMDQLGHTTRTLCRQLRKHNLNIFKESTATAKSSHLNNCQQSCSALHNII